MEINKQTSEILILEELPSILGPLLGVMAVGNTYPMLKFSIQTRI